MADLRTFAETSDDITPNSVDIKSNGSAATPAVQITAGNGMFLSSSDVLSLATAGLERLKIDNGGAIRSIQNGSALANAFTFDADTGSGVFLKAVGQLGLSANGQEVLTLTSTLISANQSLNIKSSLTGSDLIVSDGTNYNLKIEGSSGNTFLFAKNGDDTGHTNLRIDAISHTWYGTTANIFGGINSSGNMFLATGDLGVSSKLAIQQDGTGNQEHIYLRNATSNTDVTATVDIRAVQGTLNGGRIRFGRESASGSSDLQFWTSDAGTEASRMSLSSIGVLTIGTDAGLTSDQLHINNQSVGQASSMRFTNNATGGTNTDGFRIGTSASGTAFLINEEATNIQINNNGAAAMGVAASGAFLFGPSLYQTMGASGTQLNIGGITASQWATLTFNTNNAERLRIDSLGNVGIGLGSPGSFGAGTTLAVGNTATSNATVSIISGTANSSILGFGDSGGYDRGFLTYANADDSLRIGTAATERIRIDSSGNVGIGTSSPSEKLTINGALSFDSSKNGIIYTQNSLTINIDSDNNGSAEKFQIAHGKTTINDTNVLFNVSEGGNVTVGSATNYSRFAVTDNSTAALLVTPGSTTTTLQSRNNANTGYVSAIYDATQHVFQVSGSEAFRATTGGNVGFGDNNANTAVSIQRNVAVSSEANNSIASLQILNNTSGYTAGNIIGSIGFTKNGTYANGHRAGIIAKYSNTGSLSANIGTELEFKTASEGAGDSTTHVRISTPSSGETALWLYDADNGTLERVTVGAADSGGVGFKCLRIPN